MPTHSGGEARGEAHDFYVRAFAALEQAGIPFLVGGAFALAHYTGIERYTKDIDVFVKPADCERLLRVLGRTGCVTEHTFTHWLAKARCGEEFIDVIFSSGNAACPVDDAWFARTERAVVLGFEVQLSPVEEMIWTKAFIQERERFDGADVAHLLRARAERLDWRHLVARFGPHWRVLLAHLVLFGFIYPGERHRLPVGVMNDLTARLAAETAAPPTPDALCRGTLLSRTQYETDVDRWRYGDARVRPHGGMSPAEARTWTQAGDAEEAGRQAGGVRR